ncbi:MAG: hypothetical protein OHK0038_19640 [Flammeovirgaceae bacterium]
MKKFAIEWSGENKSLIDKEKQKEKISNAFSKNKVYMNLLKGSTAFNLFAGGGCVFGGIMDFFKCHEVWWIYFV